MSCCHCCVTVLPGVAVPRLPLLPHPSSAQKMLRRRLRFAHFSKDKDRCIVLAPQPLPVLLLQPTLLQVSGDIDGGSGCSLPVAAVAAAVAPPFQSPHAS